MFYTYLHCKPDGMPFYVGKGSEAIGYKKVPRYKDFTHGRNKHHRHIVEKYGRENIKIFVFECDSEEQAFADEIQQIAQLRREGYKLSNLADGGEGATGYRHTEEARKRIGEASKGNKYCLGIKLTDEQRKLRSINGRGRKISEKQKKQISAVHKDKVLSEETKKKISLSKTGKKWSQERKDARKAVWHELFGNRRKKMAKMSQEGTTYGERGESGEVEPKGANASDTSGERKGRLVDGVGIGKADLKGSAEGGVGRTGMGGHDGRMGEFKGGNKGEVNVYSHKRLPHDQK